MFGDYLKSFRKVKTQVAYFVLIESVYFSKTTMDFGSFKIRRFSALELDTVFNRTINEIFYPFAIIDSKRLQDYWFICVTDNEIFTEYYFDLDSVNCDLFVICDLFFVICYFPVGGYSANILATMPFNRSCCSSAF